MLLDMIFTRESDFLVGWSFKMPRQFRTDALLVYVCNIHETRYFGSLTVVIFLVVPKRRQFQRGEKRLLAPVSLLLSQKAHTVV